jgi:hypothetical protein
VGDAMALGISGKDAETAVVAGIESFVYSGGE